MSKDYSKSKELGYDYIKDRGLVTTIDPNDPSKDLLENNNCYYNIYDSIYQITLLDIFPKQDSEDYYQYEVLYNRSEIELNMKSFLDSIFNIPNVLNGIYKPYFILSQTKSESIYGLLGVLFKRFETEDEFIISCKRRETNQIEWEQNIKNNNINYAKEYLSKLTKEERETIMKELNDK